MKDMYDRPIKVGDFVLIADRRLSEKKYGLILSDKFVLLDTGRRCSCDLCYLVECPCLAEQKIYKNLLKVFSDYQQKYQKQLLEKQKKDKEKREQLKNFHYVPGDILKLTHETYYHNHCYIYLGFYRMENMLNPSEIVEGHLYLEIKHLDQLDDFVMPHNNKLNIVDMMVNEFSYYKWIKNFFNPYDVIIITKNYSSKFNEVVGHYDLYLSENDDFAIFENENNKVRLNKLKVR